MNTPAQAVPDTLASPDPGTMAGSDSVSRRRFLKGLLAFSVVSTLGMVVAPIAGFLKPAKSVANQTGRVLAGSTSSIAFGQGKVVAFGSKPVIVCNSPEGVKAFSAVCTHLGCIVGYDTSQSPDIVSPCHGGHFSVQNGTVLAGPPPSPLKQYSVAFEKDQIFVQDA